MNKVSLAHQDYQLLLKIYPSFPFSVHQIYYLCFWCSNKSSLFSSLLLNSLIAENTADIELESCKKQLRYDKRTQADSFVTLVNHISAGPHLKTGRVKVTYQHTPPPEVQMSCERSLKIVKCCLHTIHVTMQHLNYSCDGKVVILLLSIFGIQGPLCVGASKRLIWVYPYEGKDKSK